MKPAILLIAPKGSLVELLLDKMSHWGYDIDLFHDEREAMKRLPNKTHSLAIIDLDLKESESAIEAGLSLRSQYGIPLIFLGEEPDPEISEKVKQIQPWAFLTKPVNLMDLNIALGNILYRHPLNPSLADENETQEAPSKDALDAERPWQNLLNNLPGLAYQCLNDNAWTMLFLSQGCKELTGYDPSDIVLNKKTSYQELIHIHDQAMVRKKIEEAKFDQFELTYRIRTKEGKYKWVLERGIQTTQKSRGVAILEGVIVDIDEKMQAETRLKLTLKELKILNSLNTSVNENKSMHDIFSKTVRALDYNFGVSTNLYFLDQDRNMLVGQNSSLTSKAMKSMEQFLGRRIREITIELVEGSWHHSVLHGPDYQFTTDPSQIAKMTRDFTANSNLKELMPLVSDNIRVKSVLGIKLNQGAGTLGLMAIRSDHVLSDEEVNSILTVSEGVSNIVARRMIEKKLAQEESRFKTLWEMAPNGIVTIAPDGYVKTVNKSFLRITGFDESEFLNKHIRELPLIPKNSINEYLDLFSQLLDKPRSKPTEFRWMHKNGTLNWGEASVSFTKEDGKVTGLQAVISDITLRKNNELKIKESEDFYRTVITKSPMSILLVKEGKITFTNPVLQKLMGRKKSGQLTGKSALEIVAPDYRKIVAERLKVLSDGKSNKPAIFKMNREDKEVFIETSSVPLVIQGENVSLIMGRDISAQRIMEERLRENEKLLSSILQAAPIGIGLVKNRVIYWVNESFVKMLGYGRKELIGQNSQMIYPNKELYEMAGQVKYAQLRHSRIGKVETKLLCKSGRIMDVLLSSVALNPDNFAEGTIFTALDITQQKLSERILKENEERYRTLFENMAQGVYYQSADGTLLNANKAALNMLGITRAQFLGKEPLPSPWKFIYENMEEIPEDEFPANVSIKTGKKLVEVVIGVFNPKLQKYVWLSVNTQPQFRSGEEDPYQVFVTLHDLTDIKNAEIELNKGYREIKMLSRRTEEIREEERKQIARNLHDDLGQILTAIKMDVGWVKNRLANKEEMLVQRVDTTLEIIDEAIGGIQRITSQLRPPILDNLGLFEALRSLLSDFQLRTGITTKVQLPNEEAPLHPDFMISVYRMIQEGLTNVIRHAQATHVGLIISEKNNIFEIQMKDNGLGIKQENIHASDSLGIIGIKERVLRWNGEFNLSGKVGEGTLLSISLPLYKTEV